MVSEGPLPVVWCLRDNQLVPHQVSGVKLQGVVTGAHIAAVTDFLRMVSGKPILLPPTALPEDSDNDVNQEKEDSGRRRKLSMQVEVPCVFLTESALNKAKSRSNSLEERRSLPESVFDLKGQSKPNLDNMNSFINTSDIMNCSKESNEFVSCLTSLSETENELSKLPNVLESISEKPCKKIKRIITLDENDPSLVTSEVQEESDILHRITRYIDLDKEEVFSQNSIIDKDNASQRITRIIDLEKDNSFPSMARIIEMENEISNERRVSLTNERETGGGSMQESDDDIIFKSKPTLRTTTRFSVDSSCSENSYVNIECLKSLQDVKKEDCFTDNLEATIVSRPVRSRFAKKKTSVCSMGSSDCDDEVDVIFKSKPKSSQWVSLDWIPPPPKEEPVISHVCDKNDFISKWIAEQNSHTVGIVPDERRKSLPPKANELYLQSMRRFSDGLQICKEDAASDCPAKSKWHDIVKRHLQMLKSDRGFKRQRGSWMRTARRPSGPHGALNSSIESTTLDADNNLNSLP